MNLDDLYEVVRQDVGNRGLERELGRNLVTETTGDFAAACRSILADPNAQVLVVTGFFIPTSTPPAFETDGPLGAVFLARAFIRAGIRVAIASERECLPALRAGLKSLPEEFEIPLVALPASESESSAEIYVREMYRQLGTFTPTHVLAIERVGPNHTLDSLRRQRPSADGTEWNEHDFLREVPPERHDRCHTMRGIDVTSRMSSAHWLMEEARKQGLVTLGIGDGGNEIGMGKIPWEVIRRNIHGGGLIACRVPCDFLVVVGVSNWGAYALVAGLARLRPNPALRDLFDPDHEQRILQAMVHAGPLVDGVVGRPQPTVDGLDWPTYASVLHRLREMI